MLERDDILSRIVHRSEERTVPNLFLRYIAIITGSCLRCKALSSERTSRIATLVDIKWLELI